MNRLEALEQNSKTYDSAEPCNICGSIKRYTKQRRCVECLKNNVRRPNSPRNLAKAAGHVTYQTGKPCNKGHTAPRYTSTGSCSLCINPPKLTRTVRIPDVHPSDIPALLAYAAALRLTRPS